MLTKTFETGQFLFIPVPKGAKGFVVDNAMQYFIFKVIDVKAYKKKFKSATVQEYFEDFLNTEEFTQNGGCKLPEGNYEAVGLAFRLPKEKVEEIGFNNFMQTMVKEKLNAKETFIIKKVN